LDFVTPNPREVGVLLSSGKNPYELHVGPAVAAVAPFGVNLLDFDGDGRLDLIAASDEGSDFIELFIGNGDGTFRPHEASPIRMVSGPKRVAEGDFDGDGFQDAAVSSWQSNEVLFVFGGSHSLRTAIVQTVDHPWGLIAADINEDGRDDLLVADDAGPQLIVFLSAKESQ